MYKLGLAVCAAAISLAGAASASTYTYNFLNHPDGANTTSNGWLYGLRLDSFNGTSGSQEEDHFSVENIPGALDTGGNPVTGAGVTLVYDDVAKTAVLSGTIMQNSTFDLFDVSLSMSGLTDFGGGFFGAFNTVKTIGSITTSIATMGSLDITPSGGGTTLSLASKARMNNNVNDGLYFSCTDSTNDPVGETRSTGLSNDNLTCTGWLDAAGTNDWLVSATVFENTTPQVPLPAGILLMGTGIAAFGVAKRRRKPA